MPRRCSICGHPSREAIDRELVNAVSFSFRDIAGRYGVSRSALERHKAAHLPAALARAKDADQTTADLAVLHELRGIFDRVAKLSNAVDDWLTDPEDPTRYSIDPRAEDINVIYSWQEVGQRDVLITKRKKERLSALLRKINKDRGGDLEFEIVEVRTADPRDLAIKLANSQRDLLTFFTEIVDLKDIDARIAALEERTGKKL